MTKDAIYERIVQILQDTFDIDAARITPEAKLYDDLDIDSIDAGLMIDFENYLVEYDIATDAVLLKAADLNDDDNIDNLDAGIAVDAENFLSTINQVTGLP